jgi:hypothetical protein
VKGFRAGQFVAALLFVAFLSSIAYVLFFLPKKSVSAENLAAARAIPLSSAGSIIHGAYPAWDNVICNSVGAKRLRIGMRKEMVEAAWGRPRTIIWRSDARADGIPNELLSTKEEEWIMDLDPAFHPRRVIFRNFMGHQEPDDSAKVIFFQDSLTFRTPR